MKERRSAEINMANGNIGIWRRGVFQARQSLFAIGVNDSIEDMNEYQVSDMGLL
jgi:hypothetical protein